MHVAESTVERLLDYVINTPEDGYTSANSVFVLNEIITTNKRSGHIDSINEFDEGLTTNSIRPNGL